MTIAEAYEKTIQALRSIHDQSEASSISRILFEDYFGLTNATLNERDFTDKQQSDLEDLRQKLLTGIPVQYLVGKANFYGLFFKVTPAVLIPRSETEELVHLILESISNKESIRGLDIGTGSGCIPITLKYKRPNWKIHATDVSSEALEIAKINAVDHKTDLEFHKFDILDQAQWPNFSPLDFIVSNPPYIPSSEKSLMPDSVLDHEPDLALFSPEEDPLVFYKTIIDFAKVHLKKGAYLFFEGNEFNTEKVVEMMGENGFENVLLEKDMQGKNRMVFGKLST